jgi:hypothetical protein
MPYYKFRRRSALGGVGLRRRMNLEASVETRQSGGEGGLKPQWVTGGEVAVSVGMSLVINTTFPFERIVSVSAGPKEIKSTGSSSKSSSKTDCRWGAAFSKRGSFHIVPPAHTTGGSLRRARSNIPLPSRGVHGAMALQWAYKEIESAKDRRPSKRTLRSP